MQFLVHPIEGASESAPSARNETPPPEHVRMSVDSLGVAAERVKARMLRLLEASDQWRGSIHLVLQPANASLPPNRIVSTRFADGWRYRLLVPEVVRSSQLIHDLVDVMLLEIANRTPSENGAEVPLWLAEALTHHITLEGENSLLPQPETSVLGTLQRLSPEQVSRRWLKTHQPFSFMQISMPPPELLQGQALLTYQCCAHVLLLELCRLPQGPAKLRNFIGSVGAYWNWQTAFMRAFEMDFQRPIDLEKWWSVALASPNLRDAGGELAFDSGRRRLDELLHVETEVRADANQLPNRVAVPLVQVIRDWDYSQQRPYLVQAANQLELAQWTLPHQWGVLADSYRKVLIDYIEKRDSVGQAPAQRGGPLPRARYVAAETLRALEKLERERISQLPEIKTPPPSPEAPISGVATNKPPRRTSPPKASK